MQTTLYFCDKCGKQTNNHKNGDVTKNLYIFMIDNSRSFPNLDKHGVGIELCGECAQLFTELVKEFYSFSEKQKNIYKGQVIKQAVIRK